MKKDQHKIEDKKQNELNEFIYNTGRIALIFAIAGQGIREPEFQKYIAVPVLMKNHLSNLFDVAAAASLVHNVIKDKPISNKIEKYKQSIAAGLGIGLTWEMVSYKLMDRTHFDWIDTGIYALTAGIYLNICEWKKDKIYADKYLKKPKLGGPQILDF